MTTQQIENYFKCDLFGPMKEAALREFYEAAADLKNHPGNRHPRLIRVCRLGLRTILSDEQIIAKIIELAGDRPHRMSVREISDTIRTVRFGNGYSSTPRPEYLASLEEKIFVEKMIKIGGRVSEADLLEAAGIDFLTCHFPQKAAQVQMRALYGDDLARSGEEGVIYSAYRKEDKRDKAQLCTPFCLVVRILKGQNRHLRVPRFFVPNLLRGERAPLKSGSGSSYVCDNAVFEPKFVILEFDSLPLCKQRAFFAGCLESGSLNIASIVFSGKKSYHALIRVEGRYPEFVSKLRRLTCSSDNEKLRADPAVMKAAALTRLAGGWRSETGRFQRLIYVAS